MFQLIPERPSRRLPAGEIRLAVSWCRDGGTGLSGRIKKLRGMNLDLVVTAYREEGEVIGLFAPLGLGGVASDWVWIAHDEKRGGQPLWDESALVDLSMAPPVVSKLSVSLVAHQVGTSFDRVPKAMLDVYGPGGVGVLVQSESPLTPLGSGPEGTINVAVLMDLERGEGGWQAVRDTRWGHAKPGDLHDLRNTMELLA
jgi:hypothetical protein